MLSVGFPRGRWLALGAGLFCVGAALGLGWVVLSPRPEVVEDPFAVLDVDLGPATPALNSEPVLPRLPTSDVAGEGPTFALARPDDVPSTALTAHYVTTPSDGPATSDPVWLLSTIEPLEEVTATSVVPLPLRQSVGAALPRR